MQIFVSNLTNDWINNTNFVLYLLEIVESIHYKFFFERVGIQKAEKYSTIDIFATVNFKESYAGVREISQRFSWCQWRTNKLMRNENPTNDQVQLTNSFGSAAQLASQWKHCERYLRPLQVDRVNKKVPIPIEDEIVLFLRCNIKTGTGKK